MVMNHKSPLTKGARMSSDAYENDLKPLKRNVADQRFDNERYEMNPDEVTYEGPAPNVV